jgi:hypothetical protein
MIYADCWCLHVEDEHEEGFLRPCTVDGCDCDDFDRLTGDDDTPGRES